MNPYLKIILASLKISFLSFGGGNAVMGFVKSQFVDTYKIIEEQEFMHIVSLTNMFPGPLIINTISLIAYKTYGWKGCLLAFLFIVFPMPIIVTCFVVFLHLYINPTLLLKISLGVMPVIIALLLDFIIKSYRSQKNRITHIRLYSLLFFMALILLYLSINIAFIFVGTILLLWFIKLVALKREQH